MKRIFALAILLALPVIADACPGVGRAARVGIFRHREATRQRGVAVAVQAPCVGGVQVAAYAVPQAVAPVPMPPVVRSLPTPPTDLEARVAKLEKATTDAGRALLFRNETASGVSVNPPVAVPFSRTMAGPGVAVAFSARPVTTVAKSRTTIRTVTEPSRLFGFRLLACR